MILSVENLHVAYGSITALHGVSLHVNEGEVVALVGTNGAGKSTLLNTITGIMRPAAGKITLRGQSIAGQTPEHIVRLGIALVPEQRRIFRSLSVRENLRLGAISRRDIPEIEADIQAMCERFPILGERLQQPGGTLSGGEQQQLAIARALMSRPTLLMLDEPSLGLAPILVEEIFQLIEGLRETGATILIVEQNVQRTLQMADRAYLINTGRIEMSGTAADMLDQIDIEDALLGG
jgi:branched-chain amino acid transport system ATP-binding protein